MNQIRSISGTAVLVTLAFPIQGCGDSPTAPPAPGEIFQTTQVVYEVPPAPAHSVRVSLHVSNPLDRTIYILESGASFRGLEKKVGSTWVATHQVGSLSVPLAEIGIGPGESRAEHFNINVNQPNTSPSLGPDAPGVYRAVFVVLRGPGYSSFLARSNEFELRDAP